MSSLICGCDVEGIPPQLCEQHLKQTIVIAATAVGPYAVKDSGQRQQFPSGMQRDVTTDKVDYSLIYDGPMLERWATHLTKGAVKYDARNWMKAKDGAEYDRFRASACRHFAQVMRGDTDEDHMAAVFFNLNGMAYVQERRKG